MTDAELASFLELTPAEAARVIPTLSETARARYKRMHDVLAAIKLWERGLGPKPNGVLIDPPRPRRASPMRSA